MNILYYTNQIYNAYNNNDNDNNYNIIYDNNRYL